MSNNIDPLYKLITIKEFIIDYYKVEYNKNVHKRVWRFLHKLEENGHAIFIKQKKYSKSYITLAAIKRALPSAFPEEELEIDNKKLKAKIFELESKIKKLKK